MAADQGHLSPAEKEELYRYHGFGTGTATAGYTDTTQTGTGTDRHGTVGHDTSGPTTDTAMTRSEEQLRVGTQTVEAGRARLREYLVPRT